MRKSKLETGAAALAASNLELSLDVDSETFSATVNGVSFTGGVDLASIVSQDGIVDFDMWFDEGYPSNEVLQIHGYAENGVLVLENLADGATNTVYTSTRTRVDRTIDTPLSTAAGIVMVGFLPLTRGWGTIIGILVAGLVVLVLCLAAIEILRCQYILRNSPPKGGQVLPAPDCVI